MVNDNYGLKNLLVEKEELEEEEEESRYHIRSRSYLQICRKQDHQLLSPGGEMIKPNQIYANST